MKFYLLLFHAITINYFAQNLEPELKKANGDTSKILIYLKYAENEQNNTISEKHNLEAEKLLKKIYTASSIDLRKRLDYFNLTIIMNKAYFLNAKSNFKQASEFYFRALEIANKYNLKSEQGIIYNSLATIFMDQFEYEKAMLYFNKSLKIRNSINDKAGISTVYNNLGHMYHELGNLKLQKENHLKSYAIRKEIGDSVLLIQSIGNLAIIYSNEKKMDSALIFHKVCFDYEIKVGDSASAFASAANISTNYFEIKNYKEAIKWGLLGYTISKNINDIYGQKEVAKRVSKIYEAIKDYKQSLLFFKTFVLMEDSFNNEQNKNAAIKTEFAFQTEKKEAEIKSLAQQQQISELKSKRKSILLYGIVGLMAGLSLLSYFLFARYKTKKQNEFMKAQLLEANKTIEAEKKATESELKALKSQMNPHFIFNALNSIQEQFMYGDKVLANEQMGNFTYLTRQILNVSGKKKVTIATEIDILTKYLELEKVRFKDDFTFTISCSNKIDEDYHQLPPMLIQPFAENSMKHGLLHKHGSKQLSIFYDLDASEEYIICIVTDNGVGRKKSADIKANNKTTHQSFSIESIEQRLELLNAELKLSDLIVYEDIVNSEQEVKGTKVVVKIPL